MWLLRKILRHMICHGTLTVIGTDGARYDIGPGNGPELTLRFNDRRQPWRLALSPSLALGEGYMDGRLSVDNGSIYDLLAFFGENIRRADFHPLHRYLEQFEMLFRRFQQYNPLQRSRQNVAHHYDLSGDLYNLFLDSDKQYSCAYFENPRDDIETAQEAKKRHITAKLIPEAGNKVLDIGCGWGGMGLYIAEMTGADVKGITLSEEQHKVANQRADDLGLSDQVKFDIRDYREQEGQFDRVVSVGMFEHVGIGHYAEYFAKIQEILADDGVALLHTIGRSGPGTVTDPWIRKYIFPGGYIPALSEVVPHVEKHSLIITDIEFLGPHYAETLRLWRERFCANWSKVSEIYDDRFCRMWEFYLAGSEIAFRYLGLTVFQIQMVKDRNAVPMTRDYIGDWERNHPNRQVARQASNQRFA